MPDARGRAGPGRHPRPRLLSQHASSIPGQHRGAAALVKRGQLRSVVQTGTGGPATTSGAAAVDRPGSPVGRCEAPRTGGACGTCRSPEWVSRAEDQQTRPGSGYGPLVLMFLPTAAPLGLVVLGRGRRGSPAGTSTWRSPRVRWDDGDAGRGRHRRPGPRRGGPAGPQLAVEGRGRVRRAAGLPRALLGAATRRRSGPRAARVIEWPRPASSRSTAPGATSGPTAWRVPEAAAARLGPTTRPDPTHTGRAVRTACAAPVWHNGRLVSGARPAPSNPDASPVHPSSLRHNPTCRSRSPARTGRGAGDDRNRSETHCGRKDPAPADGQDPQPAVPHRRRRLAHQARRSGDRVRRDLPPEGRPFGDRGQVGPGPVLALRRRAAERGRPAAAGEDRRLAEVQGPARARRR